MNFGIRKSTPKKVTISDTVTVNDMVNTETVNDIPIVTTEPVNDIVNTEPTQGDQPPVLPYYRRATAYNRLCKPTVPVTRARPQLPPSIDRRSSAHNRLCKPINIDLFPLLPSTIPHITVPTSIPSIVQLSAAPMRLTSSTSRRSSAQNMIKTGVNAQIISATNVFKVPIYTSNPTGHEGDIIYNITTGKFYGYSTSGWTDISGISPIGPFNPNSLAAWATGDTLYRNIPVTVDPITGTISNLGAPLLPTDAARLQDVTGIAPIAGAGITVTGGVPPIFNVGGSTTIFANPTNVIVNSSSTPNQTLLSSGIVGITAVWGALPLGDANAVSGILPPARGGTGVSNINTITLAGNLLTTGANSINFNTTGATNVTVPTTGTLVTLDGVEALTNKTITNSNNTVTSKNLFYNSSAGTIDVNAAGTVPTAGAVLMALSAASARWETLASSGSVSMVYVKPASFGTGTPATQTPTSPTEFTSIISAIAYINGLAAIPDYDNRYVIYIYPGYYLETAQIVVPSYVYLVGACMETVRIQPASQPVSGIGYDFVTFAVNSGASFLTIQAVDPSAIVAAVNASNAIRCTDSGDFILFHKVEIEDCQKGIMCDTTAGGPPESLVYFEYVDTSFGATVYSLKVTTTVATTPLIVSIENYFTFDSSVDAFIVDGPNTELIIAGATAQMSGGVGNCITVTNGAICNSRGLYAEGCGTVLNVPADGGSPNIVLTGAIMEYCVLELQILNPNASGNYTGYTVYTKTYINPSSTFFITNQDSHVLVVAKQGGNFNSTFDALAAISGSSSTNRFVIYVGPGVYDEPALDFTGKPGVSVIGYYQTACTLNYSPITSAAFITAEGDTVFDNISFLVTPTVDNTNTIISYAGSTTVTENLRIYNCVFRGGVVSPNPGIALKTVIDCTSNGAGKSITVLLLNNIFNPSMYFYTGVRFEDFNSASSSVNYVVNSLGWGRAIPASGFPSSYSTTFSDFVYIKANSAISQHVAGIFTGLQIGLNIPGFNTGNGITIQGSTKTIIQSSLVVGFDTALNVPNTANTQNMTVIGTVFQNNTTYDVNIASPNAIGVLNIVASRTMVAVNSSAAMSVQISDGTTGSVTIGGDIFQGSTYSTATNISEQIHHASTIGSIDTVTITNSSGLNISIPSGTGYVMSTASAGYLIYVQWSGSALVVPDNALTWLYVDNAGVFQQNASEPSHITTIIIGAVRADSGSITYIQTVGEVINNLATVTTAVLEQNGVIVSSGLITTSSGGVAPNWPLEVSSGQYTYGSIVFSPPSVAAPITMFGYYNSGASTNPGLTQVPIVYDNAGVLTAIPVGQWVKHTLYLVGNTPVFLFVYGTVLYATQLLAQNAPLTTPPSFFEANVCPIAGLIVDGVPNTTLDIRDIRPTLSFRSEGTLASADHNSLLNLTVGNAHPQYFRVDGTSTMAGTVALANNDVTDAGNFIWGLDIMDVEFHASRHLPGGLDPLSTGTPVDVVATANSPGVVNSFARSDHQHFHGLLSSVDGSSNPLHSLATGVIPGFMSSAQYTLLNGATALATPSTLVSRDGSANSAFNAVQIANVTVAAPLAPVYQLNLPVTTGLSGFILTTDGGSPTNQTSWTNVLTDNVISVVANASATRLINFNVGNTVNSTTLTIKSNQSTSQTINVPNITATDTLVTETGSAVLTNKTLTSPVINGTITGTAVVGIANGGSSVSSFISYGVICGGTGSGGASVTTALQQVSQAGAAAGQVLTYVSSTALPTWQTVGSGGWTTVKITSDQTLTGTTVANITELVTATLTASTLYEIDCMLFFNTASNGSGVTVGVNATGSVAGTPYVIVNGNSSAGGQVSDAQSTVNNTTGSSFCTTAQAGVVNIRGWVVTGTGSPTIQIIAAKNTGAATILAKTGSRLSYRLA